MAKKKVVRLQDCGKYTSGNIQKSKTVANTYRLFLNYKDEEGNYKAKTKTYRPENSKAPSASALEGLLRTWAKELLDGEAEAKRKAQEDAEAKKRAAEAKKNQKPTVSEYVSKYIESNQKAGLRTKSDYRCDLKTKIAPYLGSYRLDELTPDIVEAWVNTLATKYAPKTIRKAFVVFRSAMQQAVERDVIAKDPCRTVTTPELQKKNPNALDELGRAAVLNEISQDLTNPVYMSFAMALLMGMRSGEICGLKWRYVSLERKELDVVYSLGRDNNRTGSDHWYLKDPKNEGSIRTLTIPDQLIPALRKMQAKAKEDAFTQNMDFQEFFVTGFADGSPMNGDMVTHRWRDKAIELNLKGTTDGKRPTLHDLRHTYATKQILDGTDIKTVSSLLGHKNAAMTLNIYTSADPNAKKQAAQKVANSMFEEAAKYAANGEVIQFDKTGTEN